MSALKAPSKATKECTGCHKPAVDGTKLRRCGRYHLTIYCSQACLEANKLFHAGVCASASKGLSPVESTALSQPYDSLLMKNSHVYQDQFMPMVIEVAKKIGPLCALPPELSPPGEIIPLELVFEFDYPREGLRDQFTLVESNVFTYPTFVDDLRGHRGGDTETAEDFKKNAVDFGARGGQLPMMFDIWMKWRHAKDVPHTDPGFHTGFPRFIGFFGAGGARRSDVQLPEGASRSSRCQAPSSTRAES